MGDVDTYFSYLNDDILSIVLIYTSPDAGVPDVIQQNLSLEFSWSKLIMDRYPYYSYTIKRANNTSSILGITTSYDTSLNEDTYKILLYLESLSDELGNVIKYGYSSSEDCDITYVLSYIWAYGSTSQFNEDKLMAIAANILSYRCLISSLYRSSLSQINDHKKYLKIEI